MRISDWSSDVCSSDLGLPAQTVMADAAYDSDRLRRKIAEKGALAVIPNNPSRCLKHPLDKHLYAQRHLVECCFSKLKPFRRVATASKRPPGTTSQSSHPPQSSSSYANCPQILAELQRGMSAPHAFICPKHIDMCFPIDYMRH